MKDNPREAAEFKTDFERMQKAISKASNPQMADSTDMFESMSDMWEEAERGLHIATAADYPDGLSEIAKDGCKKFRVAAALEAAKRYSNISTVEVADKIGAWRSLPGSDKPMYQCM